MKKTLLILLTTAITSLQAQNYTYLGDFNTDGTPKYLETPGENISLETREMISNSLPESYPVPDYNPQYIKAGDDTDIKIIKDADVTEANNITSAYDGGLESNGDLANLIAKRNFKREKKTVKNLKKSIKTHFAREA
ncbi:hypothetical protein [uncultured Polaribacter sp.]|uniref:hypothetical protein n=1 Tax=uncultured Polaribacter sp. TaxID=174711 RepID=UPI002630DDD1|nr:hypothetical protein [uncultured Polaribacter sp.]